MTALEISAAIDASLREAVDNIESPRERCGAPASKVVRCRVVHANFLLSCTACVDRADAAIRARGHETCNTCTDTGSRLADVAEVLEINGGGRLS